MTANITDLLRELERERFYGSVEIKLEAGRIVLLRKTETVKPTDFRNCRGIDEINSKRNGI